MAPGRRARPPAAPGPRWSWRGTTLQCSEGVTQGLAVLRARLADERDEGRRAVVRVGLLRELAEGLPHHLRGHGSAGLGGPVAPRATHALAFDEILAGH